MGNIEEASQKAMRWTYWGVSFVNSLHAGKFFKIFVRLLIFFEINFFEKFLQELPLECQTVWIQNRPDVLSGLIWVQTVCEGNQQPKLVGKDLRQ